MAPAWRRRRLRPVIFNEDLGEGTIQPSGIIGSIIGAIIALLIWRALGGRRYRALR